MADLSALLAQLSQVQKQPAPQQNAQAPSPFASLNINLSPPTAPPANPQPLGGLPPAAPSPFANLNFGAPPPLPQQMGPPTLPPMPTMPLTPAPVQAPPPEPPKPQPEPSQDISGGFQIPDLSLSLDIPQIGLGIPVTPEPEKKEEPVEQKTIKVDFVAFSKKDDFTAICKYSVQPGSSIQSAIDNAKNCSIIEIAAGEYNEELTIIKQLHLVGKGKVTVKGIGAADTVMTSSPHVILENIDFIQIDTRGGGAMTCQNGYTKAVNCTFTSETISAVQVVGTSCCELDNCLLRGSHNPCLMSVEQSQVYAFRCNFTNSKTFGTLANDNSSMTLEFCQSYENITSGVNAVGNANLFVKGGTIRNNQNCGFEITTAGSVTIQDAEIKDQENGTGFLIQGENVKALITDSTFVNNQLACIKASSGAKVVSKQNSFDGAKQNVLVLAHENGVVDLENDTLTGECISALAVFDKGTIQAKGIKIADVSGAAALAYEGGKLFIDGGEVTAATATAFQIRDQAEFSLTNINIQNSKDLSIALLSDATGTIENCNVVGGAGVGLEATGVSKVTVSNSKFLQNAVCGASIHDNVSLQFSNCEFSNNGQIGLDVTGENTTPVFTQCVFSGSSEACINANQGCAPQFVNCQIANGPKIGVSIVNLSTPYFKGCDISAIGVAGLSISGGSKPIFEECNIHDNNNFGAQIHQPGTLATFVSTYFTNHIKSVSIVALNQANIVCKGCFFSGSLQPHFEIRDASTVQLENCDVSNSGRGTGIQVHAGGILNLVNTNIHDEAKLGLMIGDRGTVSIQGGTISNCGQAGILCMTNGVLKMQGATLDHNGQFSMQLLAGSTAEITGCTISNHTMFGFVMARGANVEYSDNNFSNNGQRDIYIN